MARVVGIDPGTVTFDLCGLDDRHVILDRTLPTPRLASDPSLIVEELRAAAPLDLIAGPSGYGLPLTPIDRLTDRDLALAYLPLPGEHGREDGIVGLRAVMAALRDSELPIVLTPGVIHLPTVPDHRKANRIDMGTADKLCAAALAIEDQTGRLGIEYEDASFILLEVGGAFSAVLAVEGGRVVDGAGGTSGPLGFRAAGAMDGELACLLGGFPKDVLFSGGAAFIAGDPAITPDEMGARGGAAARRGRAALIESLVKGIAAARVTVPRPREILLSGRLTRCDWLVAELEREIAKVTAVPVRRVAGLGTRAKAAAQGAALIADGLAGGRRSGLVEALRLREASGTALDHIHVQGAGRVREAIAG